MARGKKHTSEQIVNLLRQVEVAVASGKTTAQAERSCDYGADLLPVAQGVGRLASGPGAASEGASTPRTKTYPWGPGAVRSIMPAGRA
jgi:hypothetical protein